MTKFEKTIKAKEETLNQRITKKNFEDANNILPKLRAWEKLQQEYSDLTEKVYGRRRRSYHTSIEETVQDIETLKDMIENPDKYKPKPVEPILKPRKKSAFDSQSKNVKEL